MKQTKFQEISQKCSPYTFICSRLTHVLSLKRVLQKLLKVYRVVSKYFLCQIWSEDGGGENVHVSNKTGGASIFMYMCIHFCTRLSKVDNSCLTFMVSYHLLWTLVDVPLVLEKKNMYNIFLYIQVWFRNRAIVPNAACKKQDRTTVYFVIFLICF